MKVAEYYIIPKDKLEGHIKQKTKANAFAAQYEKTLDGEEYEVVKVLRQKPAVAAVEGNG